jgi:hypothetical protein
MVKRVALMISVAVGAVFLAVWPHEVGHSVVAYLFGCKESWWRTNVSWFLFNSQGGTIDYACLAARGHGALGLTEFGGIAVNLLLLGALTLGLRGGARSDLEARGDLTRFGFVAAFVWALANYAEAFSYLVLNAILLKSDMETVVTESGVSRWVWLAAGSALAVAFARALRKPARRAAGILAGATGSGPSWSRRFVIYVASMGIVMAAARGVLR